MDYEAGELRIEKQNSFFVQDKKRFVAYANMLADDRKECFEYAYGMSYGGKGKHRKNRSGGTLKRTNGQIFINSFQGKMAEFAVYRFLQSRNIDSPKPDTEKYDLGKWDLFDLECQKKHISIKSTKDRGNLLLLETKDWNDNGEYRPNLDKGTSKYDYTLLVRFSPDGEAIMKANKLLYQKDNEIPENIRDILVEKVQNVEWSYDFPGFIFFRELLKMIRERRIIPKGAILNGTTEMDAENFYFQAGNMHSVIELYTRNLDEKDDLPRLKRKCPLCGGELVQRKGPYSVFWGCTNFFSEPSCRHTEPIEHC